MECTRITNLWFIILLRSLPLLFFPFMGWGGERESKVREMENEDRRKSSSLPSPPHLLFYSSFIFCLLLLVPRLLLTHFQTRQNRKSIRLQGREDLGIKTKEIGQKVGIESKDNEEGGGGGKKRKDDSRRKTQWCLSHDLSLLSRFYSFNERTPDSCTIFENNWEKKQEKAPQKESNRFIDTRITKVIIDDCTFFFLRLDSSLETNETSPDLSSSILFCPISFA